MKYTRFRELLLKASSLNFPQQKALIYRQLKDWQGAAEQTDDIMLIGFAIPLKEDEDW